MRSNDGMTAAGTYAASGDKVRPDPTPFDEGVLPGEDLPAAWWNYFLNLFSTNSDLTKDRVGNILAELTTVLASSGLTPNGDGPATQVDSALKLKYLSRVGLTITDFNALNTADLPRGSLTSFKAAAAATNGPSAVETSGIIFRQDTVTDDAVILCMIKAPVIAGNVSPAYIRWRVAGAWQTWTQVTLSNILATHEALTASASMKAHAQASAATPLMDGVAAVGTDNGKYARENHVHPTDTSLVSTTDFMPSNQQVDVTSSATVYAQPSVPGVGELLVCAVHAKGTADSAVVGVKLPATGTYAYSFFGLAYPPTSLLSSDGVQIKGSGSAAGGTVVRSYTSGPNGGDMSGILILKRLA